MIKQGAPILVASAPAEKAEEGAASTPPPPKVCLDAQEGPLWGT